MYSLFSAAFAQGNMAQRDSVRQLRDNRNIEIVTMCPLAEFNILSCNLQENALIIENRVYLQSINIVIETCNSSLSPMFTYSNGRIIERDNLRCPTKIPLGQLNIMFDFDIFINQTTNFTVIGTTVSWNS